jgi:hypothetical protein
MATLNELADRCSVIEESYEFMLAYAAQGIAGEEGGLGSQIRDSLDRAAKALAGLQGVAAHEPKLQTFLKVLDRDAGDALAAVELVLAQRSISSQLVDNLNASIHLRALLTDLFLIDEVLKHQQRNSPA